MFAVQSLGIKGDKNFGKRSKLYDLCEPINLQLFFYLRISFGSLEVICDEFKKFVDDFKPDLIFAQFWIEVI